MKLIKSMQPTDWLWKLAGLLSYLGFCFVFACAILGINWR